MNCKNPLTLSQDIASLGFCTSMLETKNDELSIAYNDLSREHEALSTAFLQLQAHVYDLDNRNRRNNLRNRGAPESVTDLTSYTTKLFKSPLPNMAASSLMCDCIHRGLRTNPPRDILLCMKDFLTKEEILRAARNSPNH